MRLRSLPEQTPDTLLCLSLTILEGSVLPSIKLDRISIGKKSVIPSSACQKPCLKLAANVICSMQENFPLIQGVVDKTVIPFKPPIPPLHVTPFLPLPRAFNRSPRQPWPAWVRVIEDGSSTAFCVGSKNLEHRNFCHS